MVSVRPYDWSKTELLISHAVWIVDQFRNYLDQGFVKDNFKYAIAKMGFSSLAE